MHTVPIRAAQGVHNENYIFPIFVDIGDYSPIFLYQDMLHHDDGQSKRTVISAHGALRGVYVRPARLCESGCGQ